MHKLSDAQRRALEQLHVHLDHPAPAILTVEQLLTSSGTDRLLDTMKTLSQAPTPAVAASVFMRRYGFFLTALLKLFSSEHIRWAGSLSDIAIRQTDHSIHFALSPAKFEKIRTANRSVELRRILEQYGHPVVTQISPSAKISTFILWENVWGYVLWMYAQLFDDPVFRPQAKADLSLLLEDELWKPNMRRSPFKHFLRNQSTEEAMREYKRVTCCLYKELPGTDKCPYCPLVQKSP